MGEDKPTFRWSELKKFKRCRRSWYNGYVLNLRKPEFSGEAAPRVKRDAGTLFHKDLLEHYYRGETAAPGAWLRTQTPPVSAAYGKEWQDTYTLAQIMLDGYGEWLADEGMDMGERTLGTEVEYVVDLGPVNLTVHIDRLVMDETFDRLIVEDLKTVDSLSKGESFAVDEQLLTYAWVTEQIHGRPVSACRHRMARRVKRTARATPPFYGEVEINPNRAQMDAIESHIRATVTDMLRVLGDNGPFYPNVTGDCSWDCDFLPICAMHDDGSDLAGVRQELYIKREENKGAQ